MGHRLPHLLDMLPVDRPEPDALLLERFARDRGRLLACPGRLFRHGRNRRAGGGCQVAERAILQQPALAPQRAVGT